MERRKGHDWKESVVSRLASNLPTTEDGGLQRCSTSSNPVGQGCARGLSLYASLRKATGSTDCMSCGRASMACRFFSKSLPFMSRASVTSEQPPIGATLRNVGILGLLSSAPHKQ